MRAILACFWHAGVSDKSLDSCHSGGNPHQGPNTAALSRPLEQQSSLQCLDKKHDCQAESKLDVWSRVCECLFTTLLPTSSLAACTVLWRAQKYQWTVLKKNINCTAPPLWLPFLEISPCLLRSFINMAFKCHFLHHVYNRHMQITCSACYFMCFLYIKEFVQVLRKLLPPSTPLTELMFSLA